MNSQYKTLIKDTFIFAVGKLGSKLILFLLVPIYTYFLSAEEYGISELVFSTSQIIIPIVSVMIFDGMMRFGLEKGANKSNVLLIGFIIIILDFGLPFLLLPLSKLYLPLYEWRWYIYWNIILYTAYNVVLNYLKINDRNKAFASVSLLQTLLIALFGVLFLVVLRLGIKGYLLAGNLSLLFAFFITFFVSKAYNGLKVAVLDVSLLKSILIYSAPLAANTLAWHIASFADKIMLERMVDANALGLYTLAAKIPSLINVFIAIFQQSWGISSIKEFETSNDTKFYTNVFKVYYIGIFALCILFTTFIKPFMSIYVGKNFSNTWQYVPLLLVSTCFSALTVYYAGLYGALKKSVNIMNTVIISGIINILLNFILIRHFDIFGAIIGTLVSYITMFIIRAIDVNRIIVLRINWKTFILNTIILLGHSTICTLNFHVHSIGTVFILLFIWFNRAEFKQIINRGKNMIKRI